MLCERCHKNPVAVLLKNNINGVKQELRLCHECAELSKLPMSLEDFITEFLSTSFFPEQLGASKTDTPGPTACPQCGLTYNKIKSTGRLGCSQCYFTFRHQMNSLLKNLQGSNQHQGKFPKKFGAVLLTKRRLEQLRLKLGKAVENEEFEEAARLRDEIRLLQNAGGELR